MEIGFEPLEGATVSDYIKTGVQAYNEHYLHLWKDRNSDSYISISFTEETVNQELTNSNSLNFLIKYEDLNVGILKISKNKGWGKWKDRNALYLHRLYLLNAYSGKGIGRTALEFTEKSAINLNKKVVWLEAMKKGDALNFYLKNGFNIVGETSIELKGIKPTEKEMWVLAKLL